MNRPLCFVLMPFGKKSDATGPTVDFDAVFHALIQPAVALAGLEAVRADAETSAFLPGMALEPLILADYLVADLTTGNANVFYQLGVRHATRARTTVALLADSSSMPFDFTDIRVVSYRLSDAGGPVDVSTTIAMLADRLRASDDTAPDSPVFRSVEGMREQEITATRSGILRQRVRSAELFKERLSTARIRGLEALRDLKRELEPLSTQDPAMTTELFLALRYVQAWDDMIRLVDEMPRSLAESARIQEELALALARVGDYARAEESLTSLLNRSGPSSETYAILGQVYREMWEIAEAAGDRARASSLLQKALDAFLRSFETDWRDPFPGITAIELMELSAPPDPRREKLLPVVAYSLERRLEVNQPDYWDLALQLELAVLGRDHAAAVLILQRVQASAREPGQTTATGMQLRLIRQARERRGESPSWAKSIEDGLLTQ